jgi:hypothetical protein
MNTEGIPPISTEKWLKSRPVSVKRVASRSAPTNIKKALERAKAKRKLKVPVSYPYLDEVVVLGERVILNDAGVSKRGHLTPDQSDTVYFTPSYFSGKDVNKIQKAKLVFSKVFGPGSPFSVENPVPPCEVSEYSILRDGLQTRLRYLRESIPLNYNEDVVPMDIRRQFEMAKRISNIIKAIEGNEAICTNYEFNTQSGKASAIKGYGVKMEKVDKERIDNLLRQFSFLVLQSLHPIQGYETSSDVDPNFFIASLERSQISKEDMDTYLAEYTQENAEMPAQIINALEASDSQDNVYSMMLESEMMNLISYVKKSIIENLKDSTLKTQFVNYVKPLEHEPAKTQLIQIMKWIANENAKSSKLIKDNMQTLLGNRTQSDTLRDELAKSAAKIFELESALTQARGQLETLSKTAQQQQPASNPQDASKNAELMKALEDLKNELAARAAERDSLQEQLNKLQIASGAATQAVQTARQSAGAFDNAIATVTNPVPTRLLEGIGEIAPHESMSGGGTTRSNPVYELYKEFGQEDPSTETLCKMNYMVMFFMKKMFKNANLYHAAAGVVEAIHKKGDVKIDIAMEEIETLLKAVQSVNPLKAGYYIVKGDTNSSPVSSMLTELSTYVVGDLADEIQKNAERTFPAYSMLKKKLYYVPPITISEPYNGFLIMPKPNESWTIYSATASGTNPTPITLKEGIDVTKFKPTSITYATLFTFYLLFSRRYLGVVRNKLKRMKCPLEKSLFSKSSKPRINQASLVRPNKKPLA